MGVGACIRPDTDSWIIGLWKCKNINPLMETRKKKHKAYTATCTFSICRSVEVAIR